MASKAFCILFNSKLFTTFQTSSTISFSETNSFIIEMTFTMTSYLRKYVGLFLWLFSVATFEQINPLSGNLVQIGRYYFFFHWLYSPLGPWLLLFSFMIIWETVGLLGRVISSSQGLYLNTGQHKQRISTYTKHPCLVWNSNPRSQLPSERRQFMA
jgi:hypothetical protein